MSYLKEKEIDYLKKSDMLSDFNDRFVNTILKNLNAGDSCFVLPNNVMTKLDIEPWDIFIERKSYESGFSFKTNLKQCDHITDEPGFISWFEGIDWCSIVVPTPYNQHKYVIIKDRAHKAKEWYKDEIMKDARYDIITLCGSMRFSFKFNDIAKDLTDEGAIVLCPYDVSTDETHQPTDVLINQHNQRIDMSDSIYVVNLGGYIGINTREEIDYARSLCKKVEYYEKGYDDSVIGNPKLIDSISIGNRIKKYRKLRHMTVDELADDIGRRRSTICRWESNEVEPTWTSIKRLSKVLNVPVSILLRD